MQCPSFWCYNCNYPKVIAFFFLTNYNSELIPSSTQICLSFILSLFVWQGIIFHETLTWMFREHFDKFFSLEKKSNLSNQNRIAENTLETSSLSQILRGFSMLRMKET